MDELKVGEGDSIIANTNRKIPSNGAPSGPYKGTGQQSIQPFEYPR